MMKMGEYSVEKIGSDVWGEVEFSNPKVAPTITAKAADNINVVRPEPVTLDGNVEVISASWINDPLTYDYLKPVPQEIGDRRPEKDYDQGWSSRQNLQDNTVPGERKREDNCQI
ncbi:MAG: hypothetical protein R2727_11325 [Bacteroidales bacterium]